MLRSLVADIISKTKPTAITVDPVARDEASEVMEELWCGKQRLENPTECFVDFISQSSSDQLKLQLTRMLKRLENALRRADTETAENILAELSTLVQMIPLSETTQAFREGKSDWVEFVEQSRSEVDALVQRMVSTKHPGEYGKLASSLRENLQILLETECGTTCWAGDKDDFQSSLTSIQKTLFDENRILRAQEVSDSSEVLQSALRRHCHLVNIFSDICDVDYLRGETALLTTNVFGMIESGLREVEIMSDGSTAALDGKALKAGLSFLLEMNSFLDCIDFPAILDFFNGKWAWLDSRLNSVVDSLSSQTLFGVKRLESATQSMEGLLELPDFLTSALQFPSLGEERLKDRVLLVTFSSSEVLCKAATEDFCDCALVLGRFDERLLLFLPKVTAFVGTRAEDLRKNGLDANDKVDASAKEAKVLLEIVKQTTAASTTFRELDPDVLDGAKTSCVGIQATLEGVIEDASNAAKRRFLASNKLPDDVIAELESTPHGKTWHQKILELRKFYKKSGHFSPSKIARDANEKRLGKVSFVCQSCRLRFLCVLGTQTFSYISLRSGSGISVRHTMPANFPKCEKRH